MGALLAHFEPTELADFMNLIGLSIHKLQVSTLVKADIFLTQQLFVERHVRCFGPVGWSIKHAYNCIAIAANIWHG